MGGGVIVTSVVVFGVGSCIHIRKKTGHTYSDSRGCASFSVSNLSSAKSRSCEPVGGVIVSVITSVLVDVVVEVSVSVLVIVMVVVLEMVNSVFTAVILRVRLEKRRIYVPS